MMMMMMRDLVITRPLLVTTGPFAKDNDVLTVKELLGE